MKRNPLTKSRSWFPAGCSAFHIVFGDGWTGFADIWEHGELLSAAEREEQLEVESHLFPEDELAGDGQYVFLSLGRPVEMYGVGDTGFIFIFDPRQLIDEFDAIVGEHDLQELYRSARDAIVENYQEQMADDPDMEDMFYGLDTENWHTFPELGEEFVEAAEFEQEAHRFAGKKAHAFVKHYCSKEHHAGELTPEVLVQDQLPIAAAVGFIYDRIYFDHDDFLDLVDGPPGTEFPVGQAKTRRQGFPYRCPVCHEPVVPGDTLEEVVEQQPYRRVRERNGEIGIYALCSSCGAYFRDWVDRVDVLPREAVAEDLGEFE